MKPGRKRRLKENLRTVSGRSAYGKRWYIENKKRHAFLTLRWRKNNSGLAKSLADSYYAKNTKKIRARVRISDAAIKRQTFIHYSSKRKLQCSWNRCTVTDVDCLSLDHINNDGAKVRREGQQRGGIVLYRNLTKNKYPKGFQTLCHNHQWKKEILRRRKMGL